MSDDERREDDRARSRSLTRRIQVGIASAGIAGSLGFGTAAALGDSVDTSDDPGDASVESPAGDEGLPVQAPDRAGQLAAPQVGPGSGPPHAQTGGS